MDTRFYHACFLRQEECTRHWKCHSLHTINRWRLQFQPQKTYYVKQNKSAVPTSDSYLKIPQSPKYCIYKSQGPYEHRWRSLCKDLLTRRLNKCLNVSCLRDRGLAWSCCSAWTTWRTLHKSSSSPINNILWQPDWGGFRVTNRKNTFWISLETQIEYFSILGNALSLTLLCLV